MPRPDGVARPQGRRAKRDPQDRRLVLASSSSPRRREISSGDPGHIPPLGPELRLQVLVQDRVRELLAAAVAEDPADQRRDLDDVLDGERLRAERLPDRRVLGGHHRQGVQRALGGRDVGVDPGDVVVRVREICGPSGRLAAAQLTWSGEVLLRVGLALPDALVHRHVRAAGELGQVALAGVAQHVDEEQAVLGASRTRSRTSARRACRRRCGARRTARRARSSRPGSGLSVPATSPDGTPNVASL